VSEDEGGDGEGGGGLLSEGRGARVLSEYVQMNQNSLIYTSLFKYSTVGNIHTKQGVNRE